MVTALYNVIWSYIGYSNANYAMSEMKDPVRTLKRAAPIAIITVGILYMLVNIAYFAAVPREEIANSGRILAASFFRNVFGPRAERALSVFVALSAFGNVLSVIFSQGRIVQELGREGILPFSSFFASNKPFNAPLAGLFEHWLVSVIIMLAPPPGDAYNFSKCCSLFAFTKISNAPQFSTSSPTRSPLSTSSSPAVSYTSTSTAKSTTGTRRSRPRSRSPSSSYSPTYTSSSPPTSRRRRPTRTSTTTCRTTCTASSAPASFLQAVSTG